MEEISQGIMIVKLMKQIMTTIKQNMEHQLKGMNLTGPQGMIMGILVRHGEMKISDLSEKIGLSNSTVSGIIDRLEKQGLVERTRSEEDRRVVYVSVTHECKKHAEEHYNEIEHGIEAMMKNASPDELDKVLEGLETLKSVIDRHKKQ